MKPKWTKIGQRSWKVEQNGHALVLIKEKDGTTTVDKPQGVSPAETVARGLRWQQAKELVLVALQSPGIARTDAACEPHVGRTKARFMPVADALQVVIDLARANVILEDHADTPVLMAERERQLTAIGVLEDYAVNVVSEGRDAKPKKHWRVSCVWQEMGDYFIEADTEEEARQIALDEPLPKTSSYVDDSFEIDSISEVKE
jgi:hypothetical protein